MQNKMELQKNTVKIARKRVKCTKNKTEMKQLEDACLRFLASILPICILR